VTLAPRWNVILDLMKVLLQTWGCPFAIDLLWAAARHSILGDALCCRIIFGLDPFEGK
jgi:hypothetical protein